MRPATRRGTSLGSLVREACEVHCGLVPDEERLAAAKELAALSLPVSTPARLGRGSVPKPEDLLPRAGARKRR